MFATASERRALANSHDRVNFVVRIRKGERESEIVADDIDHALELSGAWIGTHNADYVEIFRVLPDGELNPTIGPFNRH